MMSGSRAAFLAHLYALANSGHENVFANALQEQAPGHLNENGHFDRAFGQGVIERITTQHGRPDEIGNFIGPAHDTIIIFSMR